MGNKIITEKDFWMCSTGCVPAPFQGTASRPKTKPGEVYITERDTSTASFIDFGCSKYMWIAALAAAVLVVGVIVVGVLTVATGGAALLIIGAIAGAAGATFGGVVGGLLCGQQLSGKRTWIGTKNNFKVIGTPTITGNSTMTCAAGGSIKFMPNIKNWWQAISLTSANYIGEIFQGMMIGVTVGAAGMAYLGGAAAYSVGGMRAVGQAGLKFLASTPRNLVVNAIESVSKVGLLFRGVGGGQGALQSYGETGSVTYDSVKEGVIGGEMSAYRVVTGQGSWNDVWGTAMMFLPVGQGKRDVENSFRSAADDAQVRDAEPIRTDEPETTTKADEPETARTDEPETNKSDEPETTKADEEEGNTTRNTESESPTKPTKDGKAYEEGSNAKKPSYQHGQSDGGPGTWQKETTPQKGAEYQEKVTGAPRDTEYVVPSERMASGKKKFDGYDPETNTLIDAKDWDGWPPEGNSSFDTFAQQKEKTNILNDSRIAEQNGSNLEYHVPTQAKKQQIIEIMGNDMPDNFDIVVTPK
ncbi:Tox-REase-5 domain-containing protein [Aquimarina aquimarini]|uniref:Tox-REase-5 domain-containing protein n=1 Tax=Aquimarina aquimarini TaxID=1191734 RepID=UPI000D55B3EC|nr:Tox-REase-5 domain-containing protein [Aquimarina aquimarini]